MHSGPRRIWLARHGNRYDFVRPDWFETARRPYDPPLSREGSVQAQELAHRLCREPIARLFCSPYLRAVQTAAPVAAALGLPLCLEAGWGEWLNPDWMRSRPRLMAVADLYRHYPSIDLTYSSFSQPQYPEPQAADAKQRLGRTLRHLLANYSGNLALIGHAIAAEAVLRALAIAPAAALDSSPCSLVELVEERSGCWQVTLAGDTSHLSQPGVTVWVPDAAKPGVNS
ncbi:MAG: histidine phosphatase family protein [Cyanobacteria bacterium J06641_5]